jgi:hypothetical protein
MATINIGHLTLTAEQQQRLKRAAAALPKGGAVKIVGDVAGDAILMSLSGAVATGHLSFAPGAIDSVIAVLEALARLKTPPLA